MATLATKYRPKDFNDVVEQSTVVEILSNMCKDETLSCRNFLLIGSAGCGKAQPLTSKVFTNEGFKLMRDIKVGDTVFASKGDPTKVSGVYPQGEQPVYKLILEDGTDIEVAESHINVIRTVDLVTGKYITFDITTNALVEMIDNNPDAEFYIPVVDRVETNEPVSYNMQIAAALVLFGRKSPTDLYSVVFDINNREIAQIIKYAFGRYDIDFYETETNHYKLRNLVDSHDSVKEFSTNYSDFACDNDNQFHSCFDLPKDFIIWDCDKKFVLYSYLLLFLGSEMHQTHVKLNFKRNKHSKLFSDLCDLAESLGNVVDYNYSNVMTHWDTDETEITLTIIQSSNFAYEDCKLKNRKILAYEFLGDKECQCIYVEDEDHTYLTDHFIPTHNTTLARIMGNKLNDDKGEVIEIDAASNGSTEAVRSIVQQAQSFPVGQKWKVFILDEVHSFSNQAWQILLKVLEEQPARTVWFLCTTNPEKIPATILSRVQTFQLAKISLKGIENRLKYVIEQENKEGRNITYTDDAINFLAKLASGGMRDALTLLDKALAYSKDLTSENLEKALNLPSYDDYFELLSAYAKKDNVRIIKVIDTAYNSGVNFVKWLENFHSFVMNIVKFIFLKDISATMIPTQYAEKMQRYNEKQALVCMSLANKLVEINQEVKFTSFQQELVLTYLCFPTSNK